jgi:SAM-dependent methyltransferase
MYPDGEIYEKLYEVYLDGRSAEELVDLAGDVEGKAVWDLCCGTGRVSEICVERGATVCAVDASYGMTKPLMEKLKAGAFEGNLALRMLEVKTFLSDPIFFKADVAICRQGVNYWLDEECVELMAKRMPKGSVFVFNTFHSKPMRKPKVREYIHNDKWFVEVSWLLGDVVHHIQVRDGMEPHVTSFKYISPKEFSRILTPYFAIGVQRDGNTSLYKCIRRG